jgi:hypothetical protein
MPGKGQYSIDTDMLQLQAGGRRGTSPLQLSSLQARQETGAKEKVADSAQNYNGKDVLFQSNHLWTVLHGGTTQEQPRPPPVAQACPTTVGEIVPPPLRHNQQVPSQSVQAPDANSSSLNDVFTVVATEFQQIMTQLNWFESEEDRIVAITQEAKWSIE